MNRIHKSIILSFCICVLLTVSAPFICNGAELGIEEVTVVSPGGNIEMLVASQGRQIGLTAKYEGKAVLSVTGLGVVFEGVDFTYDAEIVNLRQNTIDETYTMKSGKFSQYTNRANETVVTLSKDGHYLDIYFRAYDDGVAYRYAFNENAYVTGESAVFDFGSRNYTAYSAEYEMCYESKYSPKPMSELYGVYGMPLTVEEDGCYVMLGEANLNGGYAGSVVNASGISSLSLSFEPKQTDPVAVEAGGCSPWRMAVIGDLNAIAMTQMPENLCDPSRIPDDSWIKPGVTSWTWFNGDPTNDPEVYKKYIDFSAEMGWEYVLLDEGWQPMTYDALGRKSYSGMESWAEEVISYAKSKNIGVIVWAASWDLDTAEKRTRMAQWADLGISGVKLDFFNSETQATLKLMDEITEYAAELHLLVNYHGCTKPSGLRRTWPHLITCEAVYGNEHFLSGEGWGPTAEHNCILPFTRNAVGPMDFTPEITNYCGKNFFSDGHKAALPIVFESGIQCLSDKPEVYRSSPAYALLKDLPAAWDESRVLGGKIGDSAIIMRRSGGTYYVGSICNSAQSPNISLDFLGAGNYRFEMYADGKTDTELKKYTGIVTRDDFITIPQTYHGGGAVKLTPVGTGEEFEDIGGHWCEGNIRRLAEENRLNKYFYIDFLPDRNITRGEFVMLMADALGIEADFSGAAFSDTGSDPARDYITAASRNGIINGIGGGLFGVDDEITREDAAVVLGRYLNLQSRGSAVRFSDSGQISDYAKEYVDLCSQNGIVNGYEDGSFRPKASITRGEAAAILRRAIDLN